MLQVAAGLAHAAERGVVHRDIKPSNIIITPDGRAKLVDMGLARSLEPHGDDELTQSGVTLGHLRLHLAGAGAGAARRRRPQRHLLAGLHVLPHADRPAAGAGGHRGEEAAPPPARQAGRSAPVRAGPARRGGADPRPHDGQEAAPTATRRPKSWCSSCCSRAKRWGCSRKCPRGCWRSRRRCRRRRRPAAGVGGPGGGGGGRAGVLPRPALDERRRSRRSRSRSPATTSAPR